MKLNANIYGADDNAMAHAVAADALDVATPGVNIANYYGDVMQDKGSVSAQDTLKLAEKTPQAPAKTVGGGKDSRACTQGNHGKQGCND